MNPDRRRRWVRAAERYLENPPIKAAITLGLPVPGIALLETTGRRTGKRRRNPVLAGLVADRFWIVADQGRRAGYVRNLEANPWVRIKIGRRWVSGVARVIEDDDPDARERWLGQRLGLRRRMMGRAARLFWTDPVVVGIDVEPSSATTLDTSGEAGAHVTDESDVTGAGP